jgi:hypothetical protein
MVEYVQFILCVFALSKNLIFVHHYASVILLAHVVIVYMSDFPNGQAYRCQKDS